MLQNAAISNCLFELQVVTSHLCFLQVLLVVFVWLSVVRLSTCWLWRLGFTRSLSEASSLTTSQNSLRLQTYSQLNTACNRYWLHQLAHMSLSAATSPFLVVAAKVLWNMHSNCASRRKLTLALDVLSDCVKKKHGLSTQAVTTVKSRVHPVLVFADCVQVCHLTSAALSVLINPCLCLLADYIMHLTAEPAPHVKEQLHRLHMAVLAAQHTFLQYRGHSTACLPAHHPHLFTHYTHCLSQPVAGCQHLST